uniref:HAT C-terminal dimerisation domain-containing protein n=1 Tax=Brassica oleracea var. oleracea TaxID=109376 RepID=A0A0D3ASU3_BRAOL
MVYQETSLVHGSTSAKKIWRLVSQQVPTFNITIPITSKVKLNDYNKALSGRQHNTRTIPASTDINILTSVDIHSGLEPKLTSNTKLDTTACLGAWYTWVRILQTNLEEVMILSFKLCESLLFSNFFHRDCLFVLLEDKQNATRNKIAPQRAEDLVFVHTNLRLLVYTNLRLLSRRSLAYKDGPNHMWDVGGDQFDSLDETNFGRLEFEDLSLDEPELEAVMFDGANENEAGDDVIGL